MVSKLLVAAQNTLYPTKAKGNQQKKCFLSFYNFTKGLTKTFLSFHIYTKFVIITFFHQKSFLEKLLVSIEHEEIFCSHTNWLLIQEGKVSLIRPVDYLMIIRS